MTFQKTLWQVELFALAALVICACLMAAYGVVDSLRMQSAGLSPLLGPLGSAWIGFGYTLAIGTLPVVFYGAPVYAFLQYKRKTSWFVVLLVGVTPGASAFLVGLFLLQRNIGGWESLAGWSMVCGVVVASLTHFIYSRRRL